MDGTGNSTELGAAAASIASETQDATKPVKRQRSRSTPKKADPQPTQAQPLEIKLAIPPEELARAIGPFLQHMAKVTRTSPPVKTKDLDETAAIAGALSYGLQHTKIAASENMAPWAPLGIVMLLYVVPRAIEGLINFFDERERKRAEAEARARFRREREVSGSTGGPGDTQARNPDGDGPVAPIGMAP